MTYLYVPIATLIVFSSMQDIDRFDAEASRDMGSGRWRTLFRVVAPQAKVGLLGAFGLTAILASADFVTPRLVGGPRGLMIGSVVQDLALTAGDLPAASALALSFLTLFAASLALLYLFGRLLRPLFVTASRPFNRGATRLGRLMPLWFGRTSFSVPATGLLLVYLTVPTILVIIFSLNAAPSTGLPITGLTTDWYPEIVNRSGFVDSLRGSLLVTSFAVLVATLVASLLHSRSDSAHGKFSRALWMLIFLPFVVPGRPRAPHC